MRKTNRLSLLAAASVAVLALGATACGPNDPASSATSGSPTAAAPAAAGSTLSMVTDPKLGAIVTDSKGMTLYRFDKDTASPSKSNCSGQCATLWPAATVSGPITLKGVDKNLVGTIPGAGGTKQLTLHGWPLYTFSGDSKPGDTNGQGVKGVWFAATPQGAKAQAMAPVASPSDTSGSGSSGYSY